LARDPLQLQRFGENEAQFLKGEELIDPALQLQRQDFAFALLVTESAAQAAEGLQQKGEAGDGDDPGRPGGGTREGPDRQRPGALEGPMADSTGGLPPD